MSDEKTPWWKRTGLWVAAGVTALALAVLEFLRRQKAPPPPTIVVPPPPPVLPPVTLPPVSTTPADDYNNSKVVVSGQPSKEKISKILLRLQAKDDQKKD